MNKTRLKKYAALIARVGANVKKGQEVIIYAELDQPDFVRMVVDECYKAGAKFVSVEWDYQPLAKLHYRHCSKTVLGTIHDWQVAKIKRRVEVLPACIYLISEDPDGLAGINQEKMAYAMRMRSKIIKPLRDQMENKYQWCIAAVPGKAWAKKLFPDVRASVAEEKLWEAILDISRVYDDPIAEWDKHNENLAKRCDYLNALPIKELVYKSANGTDLRVGLIPEAQFCSGVESTLSGVTFNPNIPTEEVFTSPMRGKAEGIVYSSRPLSFQGELIDEFFVRFENGKVVDCGAKKNEALLRQMVGMDEGAAYLGEVALVPYSSPIRKSGILFYNTLFDENACCHLALGRGFTNTVKGYENYTDEQLKELGVNDSIIHEDFMIGTEDLSITAILEDGSEVAVFVDGEFAF